MMPPFPGLAYEILYHAINVVNPADRESFSASCKTLQLHAMVAIEERRNLQDRYDVIEFGDGGEVVGPHPIFLLRDIVLNPKVEQYPNDMRIGAFRDQCGLAYDADDIKEKESEQIQIASVME